MIAPILGGVQSGGVLLDTNVLVDVFTNSPEWSAWSGAAIASAVNRGAAVLNPIVYAELAANFSNAGALDAALPAGQYRREDLPWDAAFLAGRAFVQYRRNGGDRRAPMPDFYIGAHALVRGYAPLTRDPDLYRTYFPAVPLLTP